MTDRLPLRDKIAMDLGISIWQSEERHGKGSKVGPEEEVEGVESVCASSSMFVVV